METENKSPPADDKEEKSPVWVNCGGCGHEWIWIYTPMLASDLKKFSKVACPMCCSTRGIFMGRKPQPVIEGQDAAKTPQQIVTEWLLSGDTGLSSESLAREFINPGVGQGHRISAPRDPADLGRCLRLIARVPDIRKCVDVLATKHGGWALAAPVWDEISASMADEVGIDWSKGQSAPKTYQLMKDAGL